MRYTNQTDDETIVKWIREKKYSRLAFLEESWSTSENELYAGYYYFIQDLKGKDKIKKEVLDFLILKLGSEGDAYKYLGDVSNTIFNTFEKYHIPAYFYIKSSELKNDSDILLKIYNKTRNIKYFIKSIKLDYENKNFKKIQNLLNSFFFTVDQKQTDELELDDWITVKKIILDNNICKKGSAELILWAYFYLNEFESGINLINQLDTVRPAVLKAYVGAGKISEEFALSKLHDWQIHDFVPNQHDRIYLEYKKRFQSDSDLSGIIKAAFYANEFNDVIAYYNRAKQQVCRTNYSLNSHLYYLLAQSFIEQPWDQDVLSLINEDNHREGEETKALNQAFKLKGKIKNIKDYIAGDRLLDTHIEYLGAYQDAKKILNNRELLNHFLYDLLDAELKQLYEDWTALSSAKRFIYDKKEHLTHDSKKVNVNDLISLCAQAIQCKKHNDALRLILDFHANSSPTMLSYNILGVCHQTNNQNDDALEAYENALSLMYSSEEINHVIIGNYLNCAIDLGKIDKETDKYKKLRHDFNTNLTNQFEWQIFKTAKYRNTLFKYYPLNINTLDSLANQYFYLPSREQLNDPIEMPKINGIGEGGLIDSNYKICSFSNNENSMLMWSHYADQHKGIMIEYWFGGDLPDGVGIEEVNYSYDTQRNKEKDLYLFNQYLLTKNKEWSYEEEVRLFCFGQNKIYFEKSDYPNIDRSKINARIRSITFGYKFPEEKRLLVSSIVDAINNKMPNGEPKIVLKEAYLDLDNRFSLKYQNIV